MFSNVNYINIVCIILTSYLCNHIFNYSIIQKIIFSSKLIENIHNILNINHLTMIKIDRLLTNITELSQTFDEKKNEDMDNLDDLNNKLITLKTKNDSVDDKLIEIEKNIKLIYDRIDIIDDKLDSVDLRIGTLNGNLNTLLKALQKK